MEKKEKAPVLRFKDTNGKDYPAWEQRKFQGITQRVSTSSISSIDFPSVEYEDIEAGSGILNKDVKLKEKNKKGIVFDKNDILFGKLRPYLMNWLLADFKGVAVGDFWVLRSQNFDPKFVYSLIQSKSFQEVANRSSGSKMPRADWNLVSNTLFFVPPQNNEQRKIGELFSSLDKVITLHQRKLEALKKLKRTLLQKMFPKQGQLNPELRFPGFTNDWEQRKLEDFSEIKTGPFGSTLHAEDYVADGIPIITTEHFKSGTLQEDKNGLPQVSTSDYNRLSAYVLKEGDLVFSRVGSVDINALITRFQQGWLFSGRVLRVRPYSKVSSEFLHTLLETENTKRNIRRRAVGQTMPSINTEILKATKLVLPISRAEQTKIGFFFRSLDNLITLHQRKLGTYKKLKKGLLQKMFI